MRGAGWVGGRSVLRLLAMRNTHIVAGIVLGLIGFGGFMKDILQSADPGQLPIEDNLAPLIAWSIVMMVGVVGAGFSVWYHADKRAPAE